jgi:hypothetical protein
MLIDIKSVIWIGYDFFVLSSQLYYFFPDDHIILSASSFRGFIPRNLVVRTVTTDDEESADSELVTINFFRCSCWLILNLWYESVMIFLS